MPTDPQPTSPRDLQALLASLPLAPPREAFRRELRARFLAGADEPARAEPADAGLERLLRAALAADDRAAQGRRTARERLLGESAATQVEEPRPALAARGAAPAARSAPTAARGIVRPSVLRRPGPARRGPHPLVLLGGLAAAAALLLVGLSLWRGNPGALEPAPAWSLREPSAQAAGLLAAADAGLEWTHAGDDPLDLMLRPDFVVRVQPGARFTAPAPASLVAGAPVRLALADGELLVRTARGYSGPAIEVESPGADVRITGTAVSVMTSAYGTCVCVSHGTVLARQLDTGLQEEVGPEETWYSFTEDHPEFGRCYHGEFHREGGLLGDYEDVHMEPLMALEAEALFEGAGAGR